MSASQPLTGLELVDCAKANAMQGIEATAKLCGYGSDIASFQTALTQAGKEMGVELTGLEDLITNHDVAERTQGIEIAPDSSGRL